MANTYTQIFYHIVFSTKNRLPAIREERREDLFRYVWGVHNNLDCHLYRVNAVEDHMHILTSIHPDVPLSKYINAVKTGSSGWIRKNGIFPDWPGWQVGYGGFTLSIREKEAVTEYIKGQQEHHRQETFVEEYKRLLAEAGIEFDEKYLL